MNYYSIFDRVSGLYQFPFPAQNDNCAIRYFNEVCGKAYFGKDCQLFLVGKFVQETGELCGVNPQFLCNYEVKSSE